MNDKKWQACPSNPPGKIQLNRVNEKLRDLRNEHFTTVERSGIIGQTEGYNAERSYAVQRFQICDENPERADVRAVQDQIGEKHGWIVSRDNARDIVADIEAALPALEAGRKVEDNRKTAEQEATELAARVVENQVNQERDKARTQALIDLTTAAYGEPGRTVHLSPGETGIVAVLCYDNSHYQSDYFDSHARLGVPLLVGTMRSTRETEAAARQAIRRFPGLSDEQHGWQWKTEKYSMGHGNYLTGSGVDVDPALGATQTVYGSGGPVTRGHWEIQFTHGYQKDEAFSVFRGYYDTPSPQSGEPVADAGGALGTVARNHEHDGVEIAFTDKPSDGLRLRLKAAGFRITRRPPWRWYRKYSVMAWRAACELAGVKGETAEESQENHGNTADDQAGAYVAAQEEAYFDRQAEAIGA